MGKTGGGFQGKTPFFARKSGAPNRETSQSGPSCLGRRQEAQDLAQEPLGPVGLEEELGVGRALENDQLLRSRRLLVLLAEAGRRLLAPAWIALGDDEELPPAHP